MRRQHKNNTAHQSSPTVPTSTQDQKIRRSHCLPQFPCYTTGKYLKTGVLAHTHAADPQVIQKDLAGCVGNELPMIGSNSQAEVSLLTERLDFVSQ